MITGTRSGSARDGSESGAWGIKLPRRKLGWHKWLKKARCCMQKRQITMWLEPWSEETRMRLRLIGSLPMWLPLSEARNLITLLSGWSGWPVECVLFADKETEGWCGWWAARLADIPGLCLRIRHIRKRNKGAWR